MYRFRTGENGELVLQVGSYSRDQWVGYGTKTDWRDATVADIPVSDPFGYRQDTRDAGFAFGNLAQQMEGIG